MNNKQLQIISKPAAYKFDHGVMGPGDFKYGTPQMHSTAKDENASPLYSQEYVSALLAELEATKKQSQELAKQCGRLGARAAIAERKLATPVRLPDTRQSVSGERYQWSDGVFNYKQDAIALLRERGFTVEGDSE
ncbi:hypothetical protein ACJ8J6_01015 [Serratia sp. CY47279]|uniref:hypothetical protein n=1 Tax=Serratia sp. CY47279 TaxID=3383624 RepID=UPI003F9EDE7A